MDYIYIGAIVGGIVGLLITIPFIIKQVNINRGKETAAAGNRFNQFVPFAGDFQAIAQKVAEYLNGKGFFLQPYGNAEDVFRKGSGTLTAGQFIKISVSAEGFLIEAFVILFGVKESGLTGFTGIVSKRPLKKVVGEVISMIASHNNV